MATSNSIASNIADSDPTGTGLSVAGGCRVGVGCAFSVAAAIPGQDTAFAVSISQSLTPADGGSVGAVSLASNSGGTGFNAAAGAVMQAGVGGAFHVQGDSGDAVTIAAVGTNITGGFDGDTTTDE
jgi:hypothetical protein